MASLQQAAGAIRKVQDHDAFQAAAPWLAQGARMTGLKSLYDVPEYFRQKAALRGFSVGGKEFSGGLAGATNELLDRSSGNEPSGSVRDSINKVNRILANTQEGSVKNSDARKEMARILWENRSKKIQNKAAVGASVKTVLDTYTNQKVTGAQAIRESMRTALMATGVGTAAMPLVSVGASAVEQLGRVKQAALQSGESFNATFVAEKIKSGAAQKWQKIKQLTDKDVPLSEKFSFVGSAANAASQAGLVSGAAGTLVGQLSNRLPKTKESTREARAEYRKKATEKAGRTIGARTKPKTNKAPSTQNSSKVIPKSAAVLNKHKPLAELANFTQNNQNSKRDIADYAESLFGSIDNLEGMLTDLQGVLDEKTRGLLGKALLAWKYVKVTRINIRLISFFVPVYILQVKVGLVQIVGLGLLWVMDEAVETITTSVPAGGLLVEGASAVYNVAWQALTAAIGALTGFNLPDTLNSEALGGIAIGLPFLVGLFILGTMLITYTSSFINCLGGKAAGLKMGTFVIAVLLHFTPIANLLPWFLLWMLAVWRYPK